MPKKKTQINGFLVITISWSLLIFDRRGYPGLFIYLIPPPSSAGNEGDSGKHFWPKGCMHAFFAFSKNGFSAPMQLTQGTRAVREYGVRKMLFVRHENIPQGERG